MKTYTKEEVTELFKKFQRNFIEGVAYNGINDEPLYHLKYRQSRFDNFLKEEGLTNEKLKKGVWYILEGTNITFNYQGFTGNEAAYGFTGLKRWSTRIGVHAYQEYRKATEKEIKTLLVDEAKRRGFVKGVKFKKLGNYECEDAICIMHRGIENATYYFDDNSLECPRQIFKDGKWATPITEEEMTLKQVCNELGREIKIIK